MLSNLPERFIYRMVPAGVINDDVRTVLDALVSGYQDRVCDLRTFLGKMETLYDPETSPPDSGDKTVEVIYVNEVGARIRRVMDIDENSPSDENLADTKTWAATELEIDVNSIISCTYGSDALRVVDANVLQQLAATVGAILHPVSSVSEAQNIADHRKVLMSYFPRLKVKGTAVSFDLLGRSIGLGEVRVTPLWGRVSPRYPVDIGSPVNDPDFKITPEIYPTEVLPDPAGIYKPWALDDGAFFTWTSPPMTTDPNDPNYFINAVNDKNPWIKLVATATSLNHPVPGNYFLTGGAPQQKASIIITGGNMQAVAVAEGDSFSENPDPLNPPLKISVTGTIIGSNPYTVFSITDRLSAIKYRTSYYNMALAYDLEAFENRFGSVPVRDNPEAPIEGAGSCVYTGKPLYDGSSGSFHGQPDAVRFPAPATIRQLSIDKLTALGLQASQYFEEVRPATRFPRQSLIGFLTSDDAEYAAFQQRYRMFTSYGSPTSYYGSAAPVPGPYWRAGVSTPSYTADFQVEYNGTLRQRLSAESDATTPYAVNIAGTNITGTYNFGSNTFKFTTTAGFTGSQDVIALWIPTSTERIQPEPSYAAKDAEGEVAYQANPEEEFEGNPRQLNFLYLFDEYPWKRDVTFKGEIVDTNIYQPASPDYSTTELLDYVRLIDATSLEYDVTTTSSAYDPPRLIMTQVSTLNGQSPSDFQPALPALAYSGSNVYHVGLLNGVAVADPRAFQTDAYGDMVAWLAFNEHPEDNLFVQDHSAFALQISEIATSYLADILPNDREWDADRGWNLKVSPKISNGATLQLSKYRGLTEDFAIAFYLKPDVQVGTGSTSIIKFGPVSFVLANAADTLSASIENDALAPAITLTLPVQSGAYNFVFLRRDGDTITLGVGDITTAATTTSVVSTLTRSFYHTLQTSYSVIQSGSDTNYHVDLPNYGVLNSAGFDVLVNGVNWLQISALSSASPTQQVYQVEPVGLVGGTTRIKFGDGVNGAKIPAGATIKITYMLDDSLLLVRSVGRSFNLHDFRVFGESKTDTEMDEFRLPRIRTTPVRYSKYFFRDLQRQNRYVFYPLDSGYAFPTSIQADFKNENLAAVKRYDNRGVYRSDDRFEATGLGGGQDLPPTWTLGYMGREVPASGEFIYSGTFPALPGINSVWLTHNSAGSFLRILASGSTNSGRTSILVSTGTNNPWPNNQEATNPCQRRAYVKGEDGDTYEITLVANGPTSAKVHAEPTRRAKPYREYIQIIPGLNLPVGYSWNNRGEWDALSTYYAYDYVTVTTGFGARYFYTTTGMPPATPPPAVGWNEVYDKINTRWSDEPTDATVEEKTFTHSLSIVQTGTNPSTYEAYNKVEANANERPRLYMYLKERVALSVEMDETYNRWIRENDEPLEVPTRADAGILQFLNPETMYAGLYVLRVDSGNLGVVDDEFAGFQVEITLGGIVPPLVLPMTLLPNGTGLNPRGITELEFELPQDIVCPWTMTINWLNDRDVPEQNQFRQIEIFGYEFIKIATELYEVTLPNVESEPICVPIDVVSPTVPPSNLNTTTTPGGWIGKLNSFGTVPYGDWFHESVVYQQSADPLDVSNNAKYPLANVFTGATPRRSEDLLFPLMLQPDTGSNPLPDFGPVSLPATVMRVSREGEVVVDLYGTVVYNSAGSLYHLWAQKKGPPVTWLAPEDELDSSIQVDVPDSDFTSLTDMPAEGGGAAIAIKGDYIYWLGGYNSTGTPLATSRRYKISTDTWDTVTSAPNARVHGEAAVIGDDIYVVGGDDGVNILGVEKYNITGDSWSSVASLPTPLTRAAVVTDGNFIYAIGGTTQIVADDTSYVRSIYRYNPLTDSWSWVFDLPFRVFDSIACYDDGYIYLFGGFGFSPTLTTLDQTYRFNTSDNTGGVLGYMPIPLARASAVSYYGQIYIIGGWTTFPSCSNLIHVFNTSTFGWLTYIEMPDSLADLGAVLSGSKLYMMGGTSNDGSSGNHKEAWDILVGSYYKMRLTSTSSATITRSELGFSTLASTSCFYSLLTPSPMSIIYSAASYSLSVTAHTYCDWTLESDVAWITFPGGTSFSGAVIVPFDVSENSGIERTGYITVRDNLSNIVGILEVDQSAGCLYAVDYAPGSIVPYYGLYDVISVVAQAGCAWTVATDVAWITFPDGTSFVGHTVATILVDAYILGCPGRTGYVYLYRGDLSLFYTLEIDQQYDDMTSLYPPYPDPGPCCIAVGWTGEPPVPNPYPMDPCFLSYADLFLHVDASCSWTIITSDPWLHVSPASGTGSSAFSVWVDVPNLGGYREGSITITTSTMSLSYVFTQEMCTLPCDCTLDPTGISDVPTAGQTGVELTVTMSEPFCQWIPSADPESAITFSTTPVLVTGSGSVTFDIEPNDDAAERDINVIIKNQFDVEICSLPIHQLGCVCVASSFGCVSGTYIGCATIGGFYDCGAEISVPEGCTFTIVPDGYVGIDDERLWPTPYNAFTYETTFGSAPFPHIGPGNLTASLSVKVNDVEICGWSITITPCDCSFSTDHDPSWNISNAAGPHTLEVTTFCDIVDVTIDSHEETPWLSISSGIPLTGGGTPQPVVFSVDANLGPTQRTTTLEFLLYRSVGPYDVVIGSIDIIQDPA